MKLLVGMTGFENKCSLLLRALSNSFKEQHSGTRKLILKKLRFKGKCETMPIDQTNSGMESSLFWSIWMITFVLDVQNHTKVFHQRIEARGICCQSLKECQ